MAESRTLYQRQLANLDEDLKPIMAELLDERVTDIMVNPGGDYVDKEVRRDHCIQRQSHRARSHLEDHHVHRCPDREKGYQRRMELERGHTQVQRKNRSFRRANSFIPHILPA